jgi:hypothetical protein
LIRRRDAVVIAAVAALALAMALIQSRFANKTDVRYEIYIGGELALMLDPGDDREFSAPGLDNVVFSMKDGALAFIRSDCPDQICVKSGYLHQAGQAAACLPNRVTLKVVPKRAGPDDIDAVAG